MDEDHPEEKTGIIAIMNQFGLHCPDNSRSTTLHGSVRSEFSNFGDTTTSSSMSDHLQSPSSDPDKSRSIYEMQGLAYTANPTSFRRLAVRRRHSLQKDEDESCQSILAATADETLSQPLNKVLKPDSPGEASCDVALDFSTTREFNLLLPPNGGCPFERLPDELISTIFRYLVEGDLAHCSSVSRRFNKISNDPNIWYFHIFYLFFIPLPLIIWDIHATSFRKKLFIDVFEYM